MYLRIVVSTHLFIYFDKPINSFRIRMNVSFTYMKNVLTFRILNAGVYVFTLCELTHKKTGIHKSMKR